MSPKPPYSFKHLCFLRDTFSSLASLFSPSECSCESQRQSAAVDDDLLNDLAPTSPIYIFRPNKDLLLAFDTRTRNPLYSLERIRPASSTVNDDDDDGDDGDDFHENDDDRESSDPQRHNRQRRQRRQRHRFYEETRLPEVFRNRNAHYRYSGYDRGHLAAAANYPAASDETTYNLCNVSPQIPSMNRTLWAWLEHWVRAVATQAEQRQDEDGTNDKKVETYVVSGPLWLPTVQQQQHTGIHQDDESKSSSTELQYKYAALHHPTTRALVAVPTHFFKLVVVCTRVIVDDTDEDVSINNKTSTWLWRSARAGIARNTIEDDSLIETEHTSNPTTLVIQKYAAFVIPNRPPIQKQKNKNKKYSVKDDIERYLVRWSDLEAATGMRFFPSMQTETAAINANDNMDGEEQRFRHKADEAYEEVMVKAQASSARQQTRREHNVVKSSNGEALPTSSTSLVIFQNDPPQSVARRRRRRKRQPNDKKSRPLQHLCSSGKCEDAIIAADSQRRR